MLQVEQPNNNLSSGHVYPRPGVAFSLSLSRHMHHGQGLDPLSLLKPHSRQSLVLIPRPTFDISFLLVHSSLSLLVLYVPFGGEGLTKTVPGSIQPAERLSGFANPQRSLLVVSLERASNALLAGHCRFLACVISCSCFFALS